MTMESSTPGNLAERVVSLSRQMLHHAAQAEWESFADLETQRARVLQQLFAHPAMPGALLELQSMLQDVIELDKQAIELGEQEKNRLGKYLTSRNQARRAVKAYRNCN